MSARVLVLSYAGCSTCKKASKWLEARGVAVEVRPIVDAPPTAAELQAWLPRSGRPIRKWLNTSGQSYRALGRAKIDAASDDDIARWLTEDGKLVKRPVIVFRGKGTQKAERVLCGFDEAAYEDLFG